MRPSRLNATAGSPADPAGAPAGTGIILRSQVAPPSNVTQTLSLAAPEDRPSVAFQSLAPITMLSGLIGLTASDCSDWSSVRLVTLMSVPGRPLSAGTRSGTVGL